MDPVTGLNNGAYGTVIKPKPELDMATFLTLLTVQLANQNPLEPMSDADFYGQLAQLGQVKGIENIQSSMEMSQAAGMIGKTVTAVRTLTENGENSLVTGVVERVSIRDGERILSIRDDLTGGSVDVKLGNIREIMA